MKYKKSYKKKNSKFNIQKRKFKIENPKTKTQNRINNPHLKFEIQNSKCKICTNKNLLGDWTNNCTVIALIFQNSIWQTYKKVKKFIWILKN